MTRTPSKLTFNNISKPPGATTDKTANSAEMMTYRDPDPKTRPARAPDRNAV